KLDADGKMSWPYHTRGSVYLWIEKNPKKAIPEYDEAIKRSEKASGSYYCRACAYYQLKQYEKAAEDFTEAIRSNPDYAFAYWQRALIAYRDNDAMTAMRDLTLAIEKNPKLGAAYLDRARVTHYLLHKPADALPDYEEALKLDARLAGAYYGRAQIKVD